MKSSGKLSLLNLRALKAVTTKFSRRNREKQSINLTMLTTLVFFPYLSTNEFLMVSIYYNPYIPDIFSITFWTHPHKFCANTRLSYAFSVFFIHMGSWFSIFSASLESFGWNFPIEKRAVSIKHFCQHSTHIDVSHANIVWLCCIVWPPLVT